MISGTGRWRKRCRNGYSRSEKGYDVFVSDFGKIKDKYKQVLTNYGIDWG
jgi:hypothetical protein